MGKASSTKKVARVAKTGGKSARQRRNLGFPLAIVGLLLVGGVAVMAARSNVNANNGVFPEANKDHIHEAFGIYECDHFLPAIPQFESSFGIHTHGDGILHIHPFLASAAGKNAKVSVFADGAGMSLSKSGIRYTGVNVKGACNGKPAVLRVAEWTKVLDKSNKPIKGVKPSRIYTSGFGDIRLNHNGGALTFFWGPADAAIPLPPSIASLEAVMGGNENGAVSTVPGTTLAPGTTVKGSATTVKGSATTLKVTATTLAPATTVKGTATTVAPATTVPGN